MTQMTLTSLDAYRELEKKGLALKQQEVLDVIKRYAEPICNNEIAKVLGREINCITGRVCELRKLGIIEAKGKRLSNITFKKALVWGLVKQ